MRRSLTNLFVAAVVCAGLSMAWTSKASAASDDDAVMQADHAFVAALAKSDKAAAEKFFDSEVMWTNMDGNTIGRAKIVVGDLPRAPLGDESSAQTTEKNLWAACRGSSLERKGSSSAYLGETSRRLAFARLS